MSDDRALRDRLSNLAAAVPVPPSSPTAMVRRPVRLGPAFRPAFGRSWVLVTLVAVLLVAAVGILGSGSRPVYGPVVEVARQGDFELMLRSEKGRYAPGEAIEIEATLTYRGSDESIEVGHSRGAGGTPLGFGIREPVIGELRLGPTWEDSCERTRLGPDMPVEQLFQKSAGWSSSDPRAEEYRTWISDPLLRLAPGIWHVFAVAEFSIGDCSPSEYVLEAEIAITVEPDAPRATDSPSPTEASDSEQSVTVRDGDFELTLRSDRTRYEPDEAIDVTASLTYRGSSQTVQITHDSAGPILFGIREKVFGAIKVGGISLLTCGGTTLPRDEPIVNPFQKSGGFSNEHPEAEMLRAWMTDPELRLPEGTWHLYAASGGPCMGGGPAFGVMAEIEIVVDDDPAATPGHPAPTEWADKPVYGGADSDWVTLQLKSTHAKYEAGSPVELEASYWFADGEPLVASHFPPELALSIEQLDATDPQTRTVVYDSVCVDLGMVEGVERLLVLGPNNVTSMSADLVPPHFEDLFVDGTLRLPVGRWRISASVGGTFAPCGERGDPYALSAAIEIEVVERLQ